MSNSQLKTVAGGNVPTREASPIVQFNGFLEKMKPQIALALPKHLSADRMCRLALTAFSSNQALQRCSPPSIAASIITASQLGLEIGVLGQGYLVPYGGKCQFVTGWQGLVDLVSRRGAATVWTGAVFEGDGFDYELGDSPFVKHKPCGEDDPSKMTHAYAVGRVNGAQQPVIEVWPISRIWRHRDRMNKVGKDHYSFKHPEMYARKIPLLQVIKYMPKSIELATAIENEYENDEMTINGDFVPVDDAPPHSADDGADRQPGQD